MQLSLPAIMSETSFRANLQK